MGAPNMEQNWAQQTVEYVQQAPQKAREITKQNPDYALIPLYCAIITSVIGPCIVWWLKRKK